MAYDKEKRYIQDQISRGNRKFSRSNSHVQTLLRAAENQSDVESFVQSVDLRSKLY
ncbi:hypothetical protein HY312_04985 [Candidatus Saccharibacteria bacterium]|nr:hypothetical protein [Candidatus Saccharibacteria bacterium]